MLYEFVKPNDKFLICKGGQGGRGNCAFKSSRKPAPYMYELGDPAEEKEILLDLRTISDIGFLGKPNAGKSSLLTAISNAKPKIAPFPFTTLIPVLGTVQYQNKKLVFADIPGLIENASQGSGLGFEFLKHLNRCNLILHIVDISEEDPISEIRIIEKEVQNYSDDLYYKPRLLVLNKIDLVSLQRIKELTQAIEKEFNITPILISVLNNQGIEDLLKQVFELFDKYSQEEIQKPKEEFLEFKDPDDLFEKLEVIKEEEYWTVLHPKLKYWTYKIPRDTMDNVARLLKKCEGLGVSQELVRAGAKKGDLVNIYGWIYDFLGTENE